MAFSVFPSVFTFHTTNHRNKHLHRHRRTVLPSPATSRRRPTVICRQSSAATDSPLADLLREVVKGLPRSSKALATAGEASATLNTALTAVVVGLISVEIAKFVAQEYIDALLGPLVSQLMPVVEASPVSSMAKCAADKQCRSKLQYWNVLKR
ncbi:hypothetical protein L1987_22866 [Smallanthus sonchifolius]|uniref:Uncharacterized protein n=1 Tax=Smallanthus sonchifolius TaxID=185202 RepID=A0ACB9IFB7_9ASTR|nr:hypothetical protein L1987_22866 [Smallanthus sonchifolius]